LNASRQKLFGLFQTEHAEHLQQIRSLLAQIENTGAGEDRRELDEIYRRAHTLKGAARVVDLKPVEQLAHRLETLFSQVREGSRALEPALAGVIRQALDSSEDYMAALAEGRTADTDAAFQAIGRLLEIGPATGRKSAGLSSPRARAPSETSRPDLAPASLFLRATAGRPEATIRINSDTLDDLGRSVGQLFTEIQGQKQLTEVLNEMDRQIHNLKGESDHFRGFGAKGLPLSSGAFPRYLANMERALQHLSLQSMKTRRLQQRSAWALRVSCELLQRRLLAVRTVPVESLFESFYKLVRDFARDEHKEIKFRMTGADMLADRLVMQALRDPVMHLLRNAISHGLETRKERLAHGKPPAGSLTLRVKSECQRLLIEVEDDGRGIDLQKVGEIAVKRGLIVAEKLADRSPAEIARFIFEPGFSTAPVVTDLSGRGMGLSVVHEAVFRLRGEVTLGNCSAPGASSGGTRFVLSVPLSIDTQRLLLVSCEGQVFGVPMQGIGGLFRLKAPQIEMSQGRPIVTLNGEKLPLFSLSHLLKVADKPFSERSIWMVMLLRSEDKRAAVLVDTFLAERAELIHDIGITSGISRNFAGAMLQRDGTVSLVLNPAGLVAACERFEAPVLRKETPRPRPPVRILVVDDSITTRSLEKNALEASGYNVQVAADGVEALEKIQSDRPDVVVSDIEMPHMDGWQLLAAIRTNNQTRELPVIIVSSLDKADQQARGRALGADAYLVKREFDQRELIEAIEHILLRLIPAVVRGGPTTSLKRGIVHAV